MGRFGRHAAVPFSIREQNSLVSQICLVKSVNATIVNRGKWLGRPANIKGANKEAKIEVGRSMTVHIFCFALIHYA